MVTVGRGSGLRYFGRCRPGEVHKWGETGCDGLCAGSFQVRAQLRIRCNRTSQALKPPKQCPTRCNVPRLSRDLSLIRMIYLLGLVNKTIFYELTFM